MSDRPHRFASQPTVIIDRTKLPPVAGHTNEELADAERARRDLAMDRDTLMPCPMCHAPSVTHVQRDYWLARYPELAAHEPPPSQPEVP
jgi:hypothetical protein